jgi:hypothetical protein
LKVYTGPGGSKANPTKVPSMDDERIVGCICECYNNPVVITLDDFTHCNFHLVPFLNLPSSKYECLEKVSSNLSELHNFLPVNTTANNVYIQVRKT